MKSISVNEIKERHCVLCGNDACKKYVKHCSVTIGQREIFGGVLMPFDIHTALKQLDVTLKQVKRTRAQLPKLNREKVDHELKYFYLTYSYYNKI